MSSYSFDRQQADIRLAEESGDGSLVEFDGRWKALAVELGMTNKKGKPAGSFNCSQV